MDDNYNIAINKYNNFKLLLTEKQADKLNDELNEFIDKINIELNRQVAIAIRFGTPEEKKAKEQWIRGKIGILFPENMLTSKKDQNRFIKIRDEYKQYLENILEYIELQQQVWSILKDKKACDK